MNIVTGEMAHPDVTADDVLCCGTSYTIHMCCIWKSDAGMHIDDRAQDETVEVKNRRV